MNIKEAKEQIRNAMTAYFTKDEFGDYEIPLEKQRPIFLVGPPGIGKTAIMAQIARELGVAFVSYSMTHHTRQSALGLPLILRKTYGGREYDISEYTMSEIIASVYDAMETTGKKEGILFLDEINCVSETLAPVMLQFLQYKVFGRHRVPDGWIVVTAGNPPEYNHSVREFDIVTWDRLKRIDVEPDYAAWKEYAYRSGVHPSILSYLDIKKADFYKIETTVDGKSFVTARGWSDLSDMIRLYEKQSLPVDEKLVGQYLQNGRIAKDFAIYYDLFHKYRSDYQVDKILSGAAGADIKARARHAPFDERLALLGLLLDGISAELKEVIGQEAAMAELLEALRNIRIELSAPGADAAAVVDRQIQAMTSALEAGRGALSASAEERYASHRAIAALEEQRALLESQAPQSAADAFKLLKGDYDKRGKALKKQAERAGSRLSHIFTFCEEVFESGQELLILVTELTINYYSARFISRYGCKEYFAHNKNLLFYERQKEIDDALDALDAMEPEE